MDSEKESTFIMECLMEEIILNERQIWNPSLLITEVN